MLFINISSDQIHIANPKKELFLERNGIENSFGPTLVEWYKDSPFEEICIINGPGGFTNLRVGTLTINLLNTILNAPSLIKEGDPKGGDFALYSITKIELYASLVKKGFLPAEGLIYIGQKSNIRKYDFSNNTYEKIALKDLKNTENLFLDYVKGDFWPGDTKNMVKFAMKEEGLTIQYQEKEEFINFKALDLEPQTQIKPEYMIEAVN